MMASQPSGIPAEPAIRILVVEDNKDTANTLCLLLKWWGYDVQVAYDGVTGIELATNYQPDYLLSDIGLPKMDGYWLAQKVRSHPSLKQTKLIAVTAYGDQQHLQRAKEAGFDDYLIKPVNPLDLERLLREAIEERKAKSADSFSI